MSFLRNIFKSFSNENSMAGAYDEEPTVTVSGNVNVQPTVNMSGHVHTNVQPSMTVSTTTNYSSVHMQQPSGGVSVGVSQPPTSIGMCMNTTTYDSSYNTVSVQPTVDMSFGMQPTVDMSIGMQQPTVGVNMNMGMPGVGIGFNMGMPNMSVSTTTSTYTPNTTTSTYTPPPVTNYSSSNLAQKIISACNNSSFDNDKVKAVVSYSSAECSPIMARDLVAILQLFNFGNDQVKVMNQLKSTNNIAQMSCNDAVTILNIFDHSSDKMKILDAISSQIYDRRQSTETIVGAFTFSSDQDKARNMLLR